MTGSDCKYAGDTNAQGQVWCDKKKIYVSAQEKDTCEDYEKQVEKNRKKRAEKNECEN